MRRIKTNLELGTLPASALKEVIEERDSPESPADTISKQSNGRSKFIPDLTLGPRALSEGRATEDISPDNDIESRKRSIKPSKQLGGRKSGLMSR